MIHTLNVMAVKYSPLTGQVM